MTVTYNTARRKRAARAIALALLALAAIAMAAVACGGGDDALEPIAAPAPPEVEPILEPPPELGFRSGEVYTTTPAPAPLLPELEVALSTYQLDEGGTANLTIDAPEPVEEDVTIYVSGYSGILFDNSADPLTELTIPAGRLGASLGLTAPVLGDDEDRRDTTIVLAVARGFYGLSTRMLTLRVNNPAPAAP